MKKFFLPITILLVIFLAGCLTIKLPFAPLKGGDDEVTLSFKGGSGSLTTTILNPAAGQDVYLDYSLPVTIELKGVGDSNTEGTVCVTGLDQQKFFGASGCDCDSFSIQVSDADADNYEKTRITFPEYQLSKESVGEHPITVLSNFKYNTWGALKACIKRDPFSETGCKVKSSSGSPIDKLTKGSSGPIQIESVEETIIASGEDASDLYFRVKVKKQKEGKLLETEGYISQNCEPSTKDPKIRLTLIHLPGRELINCGFITLNPDGEGETVCEARDVPLVDREGNYVYQDYEPELTVELTYSYQLATSSTFKVIER